jgi:hypothetical protein
MVVRRWVAALLALPLLVSCADGEASSDPDKPTTSVTPTESEIPTGAVEPELPSSARKPTEGGAIAFVKHYWAVVDYAQATGDTEGLRSLGMKSCQPCAKGAAGLERIHTGGGVVRGRARVVFAAEAIVGALYSSELTGARVTFKVKVPRQVVFYGVGNVRNETHEGGTNSLEFLLQWRPDKRWAINDWYTS